MNNKIIFFLVLLLPITARAQFATQGTITYERKYKLKRAVTWEDQYKWVKQFINKVPEDVNTPFTLNFNQDKSQYQFLEQPKTDDSKENWIVDNLSNKSVANKNEVSTQFKTDSMSSIKKVFEKHFMIKDSIPHFKWKIEDEVRMIAGYPCRKAVTTICDSVVVVAFYTNQIMVSGGPESFNGLPGMILGIAIPRLYTTWFATNVSKDAPKFTETKLPRKTQIVSQKGFMSELHKDTKSWGKYATNMLWRVSL